MELDKLLEKISQKTGIPLSFKKEIEFLPVVDEDLPVDLEEDKNDDQ